MDSRQRERCDLMIIQPEWGTRNVNKYFYESESRRIAVLNEIFRDVELTAAEMRTLVWLCGWEEYTVENVPPVRRTEKPSAERKRQLLMDGTAVKVLCVTFGESNKAYAPYPALITGQGERILIEANNQLYDRKRALSTITAENSMQRTLTRGEAI